MTPNVADPFFVGYFKKVPSEIRTFALCAGGAILGLLGLLALLLPLGTIDPGSGSYADDLRGGTLVGVIDPLPYPILRVPASDAAPARAVLLGGQDKVGAQDRVNVGAKVVEVSGIFVRRGDNDMLLVNTQSVQPHAEVTPVFVPDPAEDLGRWRLTGEICDGKCYEGAIKPGSGLAHRACANLCISGGLPPVLVLELPVEGSTVVLLASSAGGPMPRALSDLTAIPIQLEGQLERRDDLLIFRIDEKTIHRM